MKRKLKRIILLALVSLVCFSIIGCNDPKITEETQIGIRGIVKDIKINNEEGTILVEGKVEDDTAYDKASVRISKDTVILKGSSDKKLKISDIKLGDKVEVVFEGPVAESYPIQVGSSIVRIITSN